VEPVTDYMIDTMALAKYLDDSLPPRADRVFREAEAGRSRLHLPEIALAEFVYLSLKGRIRGSGPVSTVRETVHNLMSSDSISVSGMSAAAWEVFPSLPIREMHDRMIAADAIARRTPLVSNDPAFEAVDSLRVIW
jgi:predicted nucleic acid-binding protein